MYRSGVRKAWKGTLGPIMKDAGFQAKALMLRQYRLIVVSIDSGVDVQAQISAFYLVAGLPWESNYLKEYVGILI